MVIVGIVFVSIFIINERVMKKLFLYLSFLLLVSCSTTKTTAQYDDVYYKSSTKDTIIPQENQTTVTIQYEYIPYTPSYDFYSTYWGYSYPTYGFNFYWGYPYYNYYAWNYYTPYYYSPYYYPRHYHNYYNYGTPYHHSYYGHRNSTQNYNNRTTPNYNRTTSPVRQNQYRYTKPTNTERRTQQRINNYNKRDNTLEQNRPVRTYTPSPVRTYTPSVTPSRAPSNSYSPVRTYSPSRDSRSVTPSRAPSNTPRSQPSNPAPRGIPNSSPRR